MAKFKDKEHTEHTEHTEHIDHVPVFNTRAFLFIADMLADIIHNFDLNLADREDAIDIAIENLRETNNSFSQDRFRIRVHETLLMLEAEENNDN